MSRVVAVCRSGEKGTRKNPFEEGYIRENYGLEGDAHSDSASHRQVSLLAVESIRKFHRDLGFPVGPGDFAENLTTEGIDLLTLPVSARIRVGDEIVLEVTQIGKECHRGCAILEQTGTCIMPREGIFTRVIRGGQVKVGDAVEVLAGK